MTRYVGGNYYSSLYDIYSPYNYIAADVENTDQKISETLSNIFINSPNFINSKNFPPIFKYKYHAGDSAFGFYEYATGSGQNRSFEDVVFGTQTLTVSLVSSVPEPGTWALILSGFSFVGIALRRRPGLA